MATWVTHLMIADGVLQRFAGLDRRGFCVGSIAPDCNVENEDWTAFTPSREATHWMQGKQKQPSDGEAFCEERILKRRSGIQSAEEYAFLLGYYAHLMTDAAFQAMLRDEKRVRAVWARIKADEALRVAGMGMEETWDSVKRLIPKKNRLGEIYAMEAEYLNEHPESGYLTQILTLKSFPDYLDDFPTGCIVRKIAVMGNRLERGASTQPPVALSKQEHAGFVQATIRRVAERFEERGLV